MSKLAIFGGNPVRVRDFPNRVSMGEEEKTAALRVLDSDVLSGFVGAHGKFFDGGHEVKQFENLWVRTYGFDHAISISSWTAGLQIAMGAIGIEPGDEVICPPYTMSASATAALFYGGIPIFADVDPARYTICPKSIEQKITKYTKAIVVVHLFGLSADMDPIMDIARKYNLKIIEDAAQAPGATYKGVPVGAIGDIGGFSFNFHKHIHTGEGGLLVTNDANLALRSRLIRNHGENAAEEMGVEDFSNIIGGNYRFTELQAAIGSAQFKKLEMILKKRRALAKHLSKKLEGIDGLALPLSEEGTDNSYYNYPMRFDSDFFKISRNAFVQAVTAELPKAKYWDTTPLAEAYVKPLYINAVYEKKIALGSKGFPFNCNKDRHYEYKKGDCPVTENLYEKELIITPLVSEGLETEDLDDFCAAIYKVIENIDDLRKNHPSSSSFLDPLSAIEDNVA